MIQRIEASNFKCFKDISLEMSNLNLLSGINSMGKSTIIQMLLLLRQSYERKIYKSWCGKRCIIYRGRRESHKNENKR